MSKVANNTVAGENVRRFREDEPRPPSERVRGEELWYTTRRSHDLSVSFNHSDEYEQPRPAPVATKPTKKAHNEILQKLRQPTDYMSMNVNQRFSQERSLDVDDIIANEIRGLERESKIGTRMSIDSYDPRASAQYSDYEPVYRYNGAGQGGGFGVSNRGPGGTRDAMRMSGGSDYLRSSVETLGSTGMRGLLDPAMRLDSVWETFQRNKKKEEEEEEAKKKKEQEGEKKVELDKDGKPVVSVPLSGDIFDINNNLEELMKSLGVITPAARLEQAKLRGETIGEGGHYGNEGYHESILQITNKLNTDMMEFSAFFGAPISTTGGTSGVSSAQKERDDKMKEEGRREVLSKQLDTLTISPEYPREYVEDTIMDLRAQQMMREWEWERAAALAAPPLHAQAYAPPYAQGQGPGMVPGQGLGAPPGYPPSYPGYGPGPTPLPGYPPVSSNGYPSTPPPSYNQAIAQSQGLGPAPGQGSSYNPAVFPYPQPLPMSRRMPLPHPFLITEPTVTPTASNNSNGNGTGNGSASEESKNGSTDPPIPTDAITTTAATVTAATTTTSNTAADGVNATRQPPITSTTPPRQQQQQQPSSSSATVVLPTNPHYASGPPPSNAPGQGLVPGYFQTEVQRSNRPPIIMNPPQPPHLRLSHSWTFGSTNNPQVTGLAQGPGLASKQGQAPGIPRYYENPRIIPAPGQGLPPGPYYPLGTGQGQGLGQPGPYVVPYGAPNNMAHPTNGDPTSEIPPFQWEPSDHYAHPWADSQPLWSPCPELVHGNILTVSQGICNMLDSTMHSLNIRLHASSQGLSAPPAATTKQDGGLFVTGINRDAPSSVVYPKNEVFYASSLPPRPQQQQQQGGEGYPVASGQGLGSGVASGSDEMRKIAPPPASPLAIASARDLMGTLPTSASAGGGGAGSGDSSSGGGGAVAVNTTTSTSTAPTPVVASSSSSASSQPQPQQPPPSTLPLALKRDLAIIDHILGNANAEAEAAASLGNKALGGGSAAGFGDYLPQSDAVPPQILPLTNMSPSLSSSSSSSSAGLYHPPRPYYQYPGDFSHPPPHRQPKVIFADQVGPGGGGLVGGPPSSSLRAGGGGSTGPSSGYPQNPISAPMPWYSMSSSSSSSSSSLAAQGQGLGVEGEIWSGYGYRGYGEWLGRENGGSTRASSSGISSGGNPLRTDSSLAAAGPYTSMLLEQHLAQQEKQRQMLEHQQQRRVMERAAALTNRTAPPDANKLPVEGLAQRAFRLAQLDNPTTNNNKSSSSNVGQPNTAKSLDQSKEKNNSSSSIVNPAVSASLHDRQDYLEKMKKMRNNMLK